MSRHDWDFFLLPPPFFSRIDVAALPLSPPPPGLKELQTLQGSHPPTDWDSMGCLEFAVGRGGEEEEEGMKHDPMSWTLDWQAEEKEKRKKGKTFMSERENGGERRERGGEMN